MLQSRRHGFTLAELAMVLVMVGVLVMIALPRIDIAGARVNTAIQLVGTTVLTAQRQALTQQHDVIVTFDTTARHVRVHEDRNNNGSIDVGEHTRVVPLGESVVFGIGNAPPRGSLTSAITFTRVVNGSAAVVFRRDGSASEAGGVYLTSSRAMTPGGNFPQHSRLVVVERSTGRASAYSYAIGSWNKIF
ncbi:MAG: prepilin-type N-terminal cleavage/methylation domain-containing protein [Gemmatimonadaceae bacterium]|nr:prepilin-type N-terminal cleavage/methylation domain-containing protein [Gemmatimonadaceae bacterium]MCW5826802.1 prepilin-type N-terminal cleavage/methylation domain-containing protein [Gemmatimonadaceae bacterium]